MFVFFYLKYFYVFIIERFINFNIFGTRRHLKNQFLPVFMHCIYFIIILKIFILTLILQGCGLSYYNELNSHLPDTSAESNEYNINSNNSRSLDNIDYVSGDDKIHKNSNDDDNTQQNIYLVSEVIDGDTFIIENGERVRLLGINAPEADRYYYEESGEVLKVIVEKKWIKLERDVTDRDDYGRLLRYVYLGNLFVNLEMVKRGFANVFTMPPDVKYAEILLEAERFAREKEIGLWARSQTSGIKITVNYDAEGDDRKALNGEYIVLENNNSSDINIDGWNIKDSATNIYDFGRFIFKASSKIFLYTGSGSDSIRDGIFYWNSTKPIWNNDHDTLYLRDKEGLLIEIFNY